jgi:hypothetical protein
MRPGGRAAEPAVRPLRPLLLAAAAALALAPEPGDARPADVEGWRQARWGMSEAELERAFGAALDRLPDRREYGGAYATRYLADAALGEVRVRAFFQMSTQDGGLQQVLLEPQQRAQQEDLFRSAGDTLRAAFGEPDGRCETPRVRGGPLAVELWWRFPTTTVHLAWLDFYTPDILYEEETVYINPEDEADRIRGANPRFMPRRVLVRFHPTTRADLASPACAVTAR